MNNSYGNYLSKKTKKYGNILHVCGQRALKTKIFDLVWNKLLTNGDECIEEWLNEEDIEGNLPLQTAVCFYNKYMCKKVFEYMGDIGLSKEDHLRLKGTAAFQASKSGNLEMSKHFFSFKLDKSTKEITFDASLKAIRFNHGYTYLHVEAKQGNVNIFFFSMEY